MRRGRHCAPRGSRPIAVVGSGYCVEVPSLRLHVVPVSGRRQLRTIKPSEIAAWVAGLDARFGTCTACTAYLVLHGTLEVAVDDEALKRNPAKARGDKVPAEKGGKTTAWSDEVVLRIVKGHPLQYRPIASIGAACGPRQGELFGLAEEDVDFDEMVIRVRRQVKKLGREFVFALAKNDTERTVPMSEGVAVMLTEYIESAKPRAYTLPWENVDGGPSRCGFSSGGRMTSTFARECTTSWSGSRRSPKLVSSRRRRRTRDTDATTSPVRPTGCKHCGIASRASPSPVAEHATYECVWGRGKRSPSPTTPP